MRPSTWGLLFFGLLCSAQGLANRDEPNVPIKLPRGRSGYNEAPEPSDVPIQASSAEEMAPDGRSGYNKARELIPSRRVPRGRSGYNDAPEPSDEARVAEGASPDGRSGYNKARQIG